MQVALLPSYVHYTQWGRW